MIQRYQWFVFWLTCLSVAIVLIMRVWILMPMYTDADTRSQVGTLIQATAVREGWLTSGISILSITDDAVELQYRAYVRGDDSLHCYLLSRVTGRLSPCDA